MSLAAIASHASVPLNLRQSALFVLKNFVLASWSAQLDEKYTGAVVVPETTKEHLRRVLLELATSTDNDRKVQSAASNVVSKIASFDFPEQWPSLLPALFQVIPAGTDAQAHGAIKVLGDIVDENLNEDQFFGMARDLVKVLWDVAGNEARKPTLRALAVSVFRACFEILEMVKEDHKTEVKCFADEALSAWLPFFVDTMKKPLPVAPKGDGEDSQPEEWRGVIALKLQVMKVYMHSSPFSMHQLMTA
jgi:hypothetical protein